MAQLFKLLLSLFTKPKAQMLLNFNITELSSNMEKASVQIHKHKGDDALELVKLAIDTARNIQMLEVNKVKSEKDLHYHLGRLEALTDLSRFIELSLDDSHYDLLKGRKKDEVKPKLLKKASYGSPGPVI